MKNQSVAIYLIYILIASLSISGCTGSHANNPLSNNSTTSTPLYSSLDIKPSYEPSLPLPTNSPGHSIWLSQNGSFAASDHITIFAFVTDENGNPIPDGTEVAFYINQSNWTSDTSGSLSANNSKQGLQSITVKTTYGCAKVSYGWIASYYSKLPTITTTLVNNPSISNSIDVRYYDMYIGQVFDSYGKPYGGAKVTMHQVGNDSTEDIFNTTTVTESVGPHIGYFSFDKKIYPNVTYVYLTAEASYRPGITVMTTSHKETIGDIYNWFIVLNVPYPDAINLTAVPAITGTIRNSSTITAQLLLNGTPYTRSGFDISFSSDNDSIINLSAQKTYKTDTNGRVQIIAISNTRRGKVNITAFTEAPRFNNSTLWVFS